MFKCVQVLLAVLAFVHVAWAEAEKDDEIPVNSIPLKLFNLAGAPVSFFYFFISSKMNISISHCTMYDKCRLNCFGRTRFNRKRNLFCRHPNPFATARILSLTHTKVMCL